MEGVNESTEPWQPPIVFVFTFSKFESFLKHFGRTCSRPGKLPLPNFGLSSYDQLYKSNMKLVKISMTFEVCEKYHAGHDIVI